MATAHKHRLGGQTLAHDHAGGDTPHGYYGHPEDAGLIAFAGQAAVPKGEYIPAADPEPASGPRGIWLTMEQLRSWAGLHRDLTPDELDRLDDCIPNSSIPDAIGTIVSEAMGVHDDDAECRYCGQQVEHDEDTGFWEDPDELALDASRYCDSAPDHLHAPEPDEETGKAGNYQDGPCGDQ